MSARQADLIIDLRELHAFLRLPPTVTITGVRADADTSTCVVELQGSGLPAAGGRITAVYHATRPIVVEWRKWLTCD